MSEPAADDTSHEPQPSAGRTAVLAPLAALTLLTVAPVGHTVQRRIGPHEVAAAGPWFPLIGAWLGLLAGGLAHAVAVGSTPLLAAALATVVLAGLTGALHLDGLADSADGLGARGGAKARRLEIMRDSSTGVFGATVVGCWLLLMVAAIAAVPLTQLTLTLAWCLACARTAGVLHAAVLPSARMIGLGAGFSIAPPAALVALVLTALLGVLIDGVGAAGTWLATPGPAALFAVAGTALTVSALLSIAAFRLLGGRTGDTIGATIAVVEAATLVAAAVVLA